MLDLVKKIYLHYKYINAMRGLRSAGLILIVQYFSNIPSVSFLLASSSRKLVNLNSSIYISRKPLYKS